MKQKRTFFGQNIEFLMLNLVVHETVTRLSRVNKNQYTVFPQGLTQSVK